MCHIYLILYFLLKYCKVCPSSNSAWHYNFEKGGPHKYLAKADKPK